jgi:hypothetical protein
MSKPDREDPFKQFRIERDAAMMCEALNELDPFVGHPPCYEKPEGRGIVNPAA